MTVTPTLKRFEIVVFKNGTGNVQLPAEARVDFYRQGATVSAGKTVPSDTTPREIDVYHRGALEEGDEVTQGLNADATFIIQAHPTDPRKLRVINNSGDPIDLVVGDRLFATSNPPKVYEDPTGESPTNDSFIMTSDQDGRGSCYIAAFRFDYVVSGTGLTTRLFIDADGSFVMRT